MSIGRTRLVLRTDTPTAFRRALFDLGCFRWIPMCSCENRLLHDRRPVTAINLGHIEAVDIRRHDPADFLGAEDSPVLRSPHQTQIESFRREDTNLSDPRRLAAR